MIYGYRFRPKDYEDPYKAKGWQPVDADSPVEAVAGALRKRLPTGALAVFQEAGAVPAYWGAAGGLPCDGKLTFDQARALFHPCGEWVPSEERARMRHAEKERGKVEVALVCDIDTFAPIALDSYEMRLLETLLQLAPEDAKIKRAVKREYTATRQLGGGEAKTFSVVAASTHAALNAALGNYNHMSGVCETLPGMYHAYTNSGATITVTLHEGQAPVRGATMKEVPNAREEMDRILATAASWHASKRTQQ